MWYTTVPLSFSAVFIFGPVSLSTTDAFVRVDDAISREAVCDRFTIFDRVAVVDKIGSVVEVDFWTPTWWLVRVPTLSCLGVA